jgi:hypothetical protein
MPRSLASLRRFFKRQLFFRISLGNQWTRFPEPETQVSKDSLALSYRQIHSVRFPEMMGKKLPIPKILRVSQIPRLLAKVLTHHLPLLCGQPPWPTGPLTIQQTGKPAPFKAANPALNRGRVLPKEIPHLIATQTPTDKQHAMKSVVIAGFFGARNLLLYRNHHNVSIGYPKLSHSAALLYATLTGRQAVDKKFILQYL